MNKKRTQWFVNRSMQLRIAIELSLFFSIILFVIWVDYYVLNNFSQVLNISFDRNTLSIISGYSLIILVLNVIFFYIVTVYFSHRIAGPAINISQSLAAIQSGHLDTRITLRKADYLKEISQDINAVTEQFQHTIKQLEQHLQALKKASVIDATMQADIDAMQKLLSYYRTS